MRFPNVYGVDLPSKKEFVATDLSEDEICKVQPLLNVSHIFLQPCQQCGIDNVDDCSDANKTCGE